MKMRMKVAFLVLIGAAGVACSDSGSNERALTLLSGQTDADAELTRLRQMQAVRVIGENGPRNLGEQAFDNLVLNNCPGAFQCPDNCGGFDCSLRRQTCKAETLLAAASGEREVVLLVYGSSSDPNPERVRVPPQSTATTALLAEMAVKEYGKLLNLGVQVLTSPRTHACWNDPNLGASHLLPLAASTFVTGYYDAKHALDIAVENTLAVADAQRASTPSFRLAQARSLAGPALSRAAAAHLLVGGVPGFLGNTTEGFCTEGQQTAQAKAAIELFRQAGVDPKDVLDSPDALSINRLVNGSVTGIPAQAPPGGSIRQRLENQWQTTIPSNVGIQDYYGLKLSDFEQARRSLVEEIGIFSRSLEAKLPKRPLPGGELPGYDMFAATATPPPERDSAYWQALALTESTNPSQAFGGNWRNWLVSFNQGLGFATNPELSDPNSSLSFLSDWAYSWAEHLRTSPLLDGFQGSADTKRALALLATGTDRPGRVSHCFHFQRQGAGSPTQLFYDILVVNGFLAGDQLAYVVGEDDLTCATTGSVEGQPCTTIPSLVSLGDDPFFFASFYKFPGFAAETVSKVKVGFLSVTGPIAKRVYVLKARPGHDASSPGDWESVAGFAPYMAQTPLEDAPGIPQTFDHIMCRDIPIVPEAQRRVADVLQPSKDWCGNSSMSCAKARFDERLPLEDELTDDNDNVESSWRHFLQLARGAANEADALGQEYLSAGLTLDQRVEDLSLRKQAQKEKAAAELEGLQQICGTQVDVQVLLDSVSSAPGTNDLANVGTGWLNKIASVPGGDKFAECVRAFTETVPFVHLGDATLCAWKDSSNRVCGGTVEGWRCPDLARGGVSCPAPAGGSPVRIGANEGLKYFATADTIPPPPLTTMCDSIRRLRGQPAGSDEELGEQLQKIVDTNIFNPESLKPLRQRLEFRAAYNNFVSVMFDGKAKYSTGRPGTGPNLEEWPCNPEAIPASCASGQGLMCSHFDCSTMEGLRQANERLLRATLGAQLATFTAGQPSVTLVFPTYLDNTLPVHAPADTIQAAGISLTRIFNDRWTMFTGTVDPDHPAAVAHTLGLLAGYWPLARSSEAFALDRFTLPAPADLMRAYWGGMSHDGLSPGYFFSILKDGPGGVPNPGNGKTVRIDDRLALEIPCSNLCVLNPVLCDCTDNIAESTRAELERQGLWSSQRTHRVYVNSIPYTFTYDEESMLDGLELLCETTQGPSGRGCSFTNPPEFRSLRDLGRIGSFMQCAGDEISHRAATAIFPDFPKEALEAMRRLGAGTFKPIGGEMGAAISDLVRALLQVASSGPVIGRTIRDFGQDMKILRETIGLYDVRDEIEDVQFDANVANQVTSCMVGMAQSFNNVEGLITGGGVLAAAATCANSLAQIGFADKLRGLRQEETQHEREIAIADFNKRFTDHVSTLDAETIKLADALETVSRQLGVIEGLKAQARRSIDKALWHLSFQAEKQAEISSTLGAVKETARIRYRSALRNAKRMAFLAKRAIEQRLGVTLAEMREKLPLVAAPSTWESTVCTTTGINYKTVSSTGENFADAFIGDYVTKLENVVESYRLVNNFHEGTDTLVASLRDDILNVRSECEVESRNRLYFASRLDEVRTEREASDVGWVAGGCLLDDDEQPLPCTSIRDLDAAPFIDAAVDLRAVRGFRIDFGTDLTRTLSQRVALEPGRYRYSWYTPSESQAVNRTGGFVTLDGGEPVTQLIADHVPSDPETWFRPYFIFDVPVDDVYRVGFRPLSGATTIEVAAPMLEKLDYIAGLPSAPEPKMFSDTSDTRVNRLTVCEDRDGNVFRRRHFSRGCVWLCPDGFSSDCTDRAEKHCYRETSFHVSQWAIDQGRLFKQSGFARGNFNYRIESIAVNAVGTGLRQCADSNLPSTCYSAGYIPYSLEHQGPYFVRNHLGADFRARLFTGHVEHARALGIERYLTNPLSDADRSLIEPYLRREFMGRPLDGMFVIRIWEEPSVDFEALQDIQLLINYRYWTRFR